MDAKQITESFDKAVKGAEELLSIVNGAVDSMDLSKATIEEQKIAAEGLIAYKKELSEKKKQLNKLAEKLENL